MVKIPYGKGTLEMNEDVTVITPSFAMQEEVSGRTVPSDSNDNGAEIVRASLEKPYGDKRLSEIAAGHRECVVIISDHTRPVPSRDILPQMLSELRKGSPQIAVTMLVATGLHRKTTAAELSDKLGVHVWEAGDLPKEIGETAEKKSTVPFDFYAGAPFNAPIAVHDGSDPEKNVFLGTLPSGAPLYVDKLAAETDLLVAEGFIEPHFFAGFSGGRKSVLPGVAGRLTVLGNHCGPFIADPHARTGILSGNPIHEDMVAAAKMAKLQYVVNVVIDDDHRTVAAFSGDPFLSHAAGCDLVGKMFRVKTDVYDIVVTGNGGAPLDQNIYQCVKSMTAAESCCRKGGVIVICAECADGIGGDSFYRSLAECESAEALYEEYCRVPQNETIPDQWQSQILARVLKDHTVIFVTRPELKETIEDMKMTYVETVAEAMAKARAIAGNTARAAVIPNGISVIVESR